MENFKPGDKVIYYSGANMQMTAEPYIGKEVSVVHVDTTSPLQPCLLIKFGQDNIWCYDNQHDNPFDIRRPAAPLPPITTTEIADTTRKHIDELLTYNDTDLTNAADMLRTALDLIDKYNKTK